MHRNTAKGSNVAGFDPETDHVVPLYDPRAEVWDDHFFWDGPLLVGKSAMGRATIDVLNINDPICVDQRAILIAAGLFPPDLKASSS